MSRYIHRPWGSAALVWATLALSGCGGISLLPQTEPAQLYRFGYGGTGVTPAVSRDLGPRTGVLLDSVTLTRGAVGDQILTVAGDQAAYLSAARWDAPATLMFTEALMRAFDERSQRVRLVSRGGSGKTAASLRLFVRDLEADYGNVPLPPPPAKGQRSAPLNLPAPTAVVALRARLADANGVLIAERDFVARTPATDNRVGAIVPAINTAIDQVLTELVSWADGHAPAPPHPGANGR